MKNLLMPLLGALILSGAAEAALVDRGNGMVYDSSLHVTWLADWDFAVTSGYAAAHVGGTGASQIAANGTMGWDAANSWAGNLLYEGFNGWRLPDHGQCYGFNCVSGELAHLFYNDLGGRAGQSILNSTGDTALETANLALFKNVKAFGVWLGPEYGPGSPAAWFFTTGVGSQNVIGKSPGLNAILVRDGDVASAIPEPQASALMLTGLLLVVAGTMRRPRFGMREMPLSAL